jgi:hypothetical protein
MQPVDATASILILVPIVAFFAAGRMTEHLDYRPFAAMAVVALAVQIRSIQLVAGFRVGGWLVGWAMLTQIPFFEPKGWAGIMLLAAMTGGIYATAYFAGLLFGRMLGSGEDRNICR